jgi:acetyltransferase-like isoleucine patch superfamily enzyme
MGLSRILLFLLRTAHIVICNINYHTYKNRITADGRFYIILGGAVHGMQNKDQIVIGKNFVLQGWITLGPKGHIKIGDYTSIGPKTVIEAWKRIEIGSFCMISAEVRIQDNNSHSIYAQDRLLDILGGAELNGRGDNHIGDVTKPIKIGDHVWIGRRVTILKGITIGDRAVIATGTIVTKDVPKDCIFAGNPGRVVKEIKNNIVSKEKAKAYLKSIHISDNPTPL